MLVGETVEMNTTPGAPYLLSRVGARAALGLWRNRGGFLFAAVIAAALGAYALLTWSGEMPRSALFGNAPMAASGTASANADCADTAMAAIADKSPAAAQRAYDCMDNSFQQRVSQTEFVRQMQAQRMPAIDKLERVGDHRDSTGGTLVYYALDGGGQSVGYIVYLGSDGKVLKIE